MIQDIKARLDDLREFETAGLVARIAVNRACGNIDPAKEEQADIILKRAGVIDDQEFARRAAKRRIRNTMQSAEGGAQP